MDLHEIIYSRGDVQGAGDLAELAIMDRRNCGYVHQNQCHKLAEGGEGKLRAIMYLLKYEGYTEVMRFARDTMGEHLIYNASHIAEIKMAMELMWTAIRESLQQR